MPFHPGHQVKVQMPRPAPIIHTVHVVATASALLENATIQKQQSPNVALSSFPCQLSRDVLFFLSHIGLLIYIAVQKPNAHYECFNGGDYDNEMWSGAHKRWCCYKYKEDWRKCRRV